MTPAKLNTTFFIQPFLFDKDEKGTTFSVITCQPSRLWSGDPIICFQRGTRSKGEKKSDTNQS